MYTLMKYVLRLGKVMNKNVTIKVGLNFIFKTESYSCPMFCV